MSMSNAAEAKLLDLLFLNANWSSLGDATGVRGSSVAGSLYVALHTADPGETGDQTSSEVSYSGYDRVAVARSGAGFSRTGSTISNAATVQFGECSSGTAVATHFSVGLASSGAGEVLYKGALGASRTISAGITPLFNTGALTGTVD